MASRKEQRGNRRPDYLGSDPHGGGKAPTPARVRLVYMGVQGTMVNQGVMVSMRLDALLTSPAPTYKGCLGGYKNPSRSKEVEESSWDPASLSCAPSTQGPSF